ncbi:MAG: Gfo/Idh/MocA family oxidoreductase [Phycisphaerae bacterium]|nr:Gfo/Idh/MocA family oxidoreductase [Phycisphaerae bacterium]NIP54285.1 Gfo/Idh/MocA family oxidoreductase [Phycisphaerae bacterium]NIS53154.1 Gfo/Idh/MocA family oxidoreductase [Phycisphaerae bacterium]NIU10639.1 Gfo/Idh/MocA family oxidoreductase [Phycisphaerae bacterium]NIU58400.1 Gfo/Idh/MocA family oxidoreductase [Phycisphaerae bacterium]
MSRFTRRDFIKGSMAVGASIALAPHSRVLGANNDIRIAVIGVGGQGGGHMGYFHKIPGVRLVAICDADKAHIEKRARDFEKKNNVKLKTYMDARKMLDDKEIDAVTTATPNHWHALISIWACQAGKDMYCEKPVSHNVWEGRKIVEAARKYNRIVQTGTQKRSDEGLMEAFDYINKGNIGKIKVSRGFCYKPRFRGNGIVNGTNGPIPTPEGLDYNLWCGPAEMKPLTRKQLHYKWHWVWNTGNGDLGNQGIHEMDLARWALNDPKLAPRVCSIGGRFAVGDAGETANTQIVYLDYKPAPLVFEVRGLPRKKGDSSMDHYRGTRIGMVVECENGYFVGGGGGGWIYDNNDKKVKQCRGGGGGGHHQNFIKAVRSRKVSDLNADIEKGHLSSALCHMGNVSYLLGKKMSVDEIKKAVGGNAVLMEAFERMLEHLNANQVDLDKEPITMGPMLTMDPETEKFTGELSDMANMYVKRNYREPFVVPEKV